MTPPSRGDVGGFLIPSRGRGTGPGLHSGSRRAGGPERACNGHTVTAEGRGGFFSFALRTHIQRDTAGHEDTSWGRAAAQMTTTRRVAMATTKLPVDCRHSWRAFRPSPSGPARCWRSPAHVVACPFLYKTGVRGSAKTGVCALGRESASGRTLGSRSIGARGGAGRPSHPRDASVYAFPGPR